MSFSSFPRLAAAILLAAALSGAALGQALPSLEKSRDYRIPSPSELRTRGKAMKILGGKAFGSGERVAYPGFDGKTYELTRFHGQYVDILLPDDWLGPPALSEEQVHHFVDLTDLIYQHLLDLVGIPPIGDGPVEIAVVPNACDAVACSNLGYKGIELADVPASAPYYWEEIAEDLPSGVLVHEMTHNFDVFNQYLGYTQDYPHSWTSFISYYYYPYTHQGFIDSSPEEITRDWFAVTARYFQDPQADWQQCVRDDGCEDRYLTPELAWGGFGFRVALLDGPQAVRGFTRYLGRYQQLHQPPETAEEKNDLYVEALAGGARRNLGCVSDTLHWRISDALRQRMKQLYGAQNPDCQDRDHDGFTPLKGDCDDRRATVHPGAVERVNHVDDDCDGRIDETALREPAGGDFTAPQQLTLPAEISATAGVSDTDEYRFHLTSPGRVRFEPCTQIGEYVELDLFDGTGAQVQRLSPFGGGCAPMTFGLDAGDWRFEVVGSSSYTVAVQNEPPWPPAPWARTAPPRQAGSHWSLTAATDLRHLPVRPTQIRFWVSGQGVVGTVPYSPASAFAWTPPPGVDPVATGLTYRAQILADGVPAYDISPPQPFAAP